MSQARLPEDRRWVQIEQKPEGKRTGAFIMDLNMVDKVTFSRNQDDPTRIDVVEILYAGQMQPIGLTKERAHWFYEQWMLYLTAHENFAAAMPVADTTENLIHVTGKMPKNA